MSNLESHNHTLSFTYQQVDTNWKWFDSLGIKAGFGAKYI